MAIEIREIKGDKEIMDLLIEDLEKFISEWIYEMKKWEDARALASSHRKDKRAKAARQYISEQRNPYHMEKGGAQISVWYGDLYGGWLTEGPFVEVSAKDGEEKLFSVLVKVTE